MSPWLGSPGWASNSHGARRTPPRPDRDRRRRHHCLRRRARWRTPAGDLRDRNCGISRRACGGRMLMMPMPVPLVTGAVCRRWPAAGAVALAESDLRWRWLAGGAGRQHRHAGELAAARGQFRLERTGGAAARNRRRRSSRKRRASRARPCGRPLARLRFPAAAPNSLAPWLGSSGRPDGSRPQARHRQLGWPITPAASPRVSGPTTSRAPSLTACW